MGDKVFFQIIKIGGPKFEAKKCLVSIKKWWGKNSVKFSFWLVTEQSNDNINNLRITLKVSIEKTTISFIAFCFYFRFSSSCRIPNSWGVSNLSNVLTRFFYYQCFFSSHAQILLKFPKNWPYLTWQKGV